MATDRPRYTVSVDNELFQQIEDFRFSQRYQTRSEATVELIRLGLEALKKDAASDKTSPVPLRNRKTVPAALPRALRPSKKQPSRRDFLFRAENLLYGFQLYLTFSSELHIIVSIAFFRLFSEQEMI